MIRRKIFLKDNNGFTLIELIVALLIMVILFVAAASVYTIGNNIFNRAGDISNKEGTITNSETNLQKVLPITTGVALSSAPKTVLTSESFSVGFKADGTCEEVVISLVVDSDGKPVLVDDKKQYVKTVNSIPQISEIRLLAVQQMHTNGDGTTTRIDAYTLNYELEPVDKTMSTLKGGIVMNNIKASRNNYSSSLLSPIYLNDQGGSNKQYLVMTFDY